MRIPQLDESQTAAIDDDGYIVVDGALNEQVVGQLRTAFGNGTGSSDGTEHVDIDATTPNHDAWQALSAHPLVTAVAQQILQRTFRLGGLHGRNPLPGFGQQGLHTDWMPRSPGAPFVAVTAIFMLDEFTLDNGATRVVPGSHRIAAAIARSYAQPLAHHPDERIITGPAGSVLVFNGHLWHSGTRNGSAGPRRAVQMTIRADG